ncbi:MAG: BatD family protein [Halieaceae bacterium]|nr:BatD family protein [Halieaceae bacterium]
MNSPMRKSATLTGQFFRHYVLVLLTSLLPVSVMADDTELAMRVIATPPFVPSQVITVELTLQTDSPVVGSADFALPELEFGVWLEQSRASYNGFTIKNGRRVPTLVTTYALWIQGVGQFQIPAVHTTVPVLLDGERRRLIAQAPAVSLTVRYPQSPVDEFLVADEAEFTSDVVLPAEVEVGQVIEQVLTVRAKGALPVSFPSLIVPDFVGFKLDQLPANSRVQYTRGEVSSTQTITLRYTPSQIGAMQIPAYSVSWWNTQTHSFHTLRSPVHDILVKSSPSYSSRGFTWEWLQLAVFVLVALLGGFVLYRAAAALRVLLSKLRAPVLPDRLNP